MSEQETRRHETVVEIPATVEEVWNAITQASEVTRWFAPIARIDPRVGGEYFVSWGPGMDGPGKIEVFDAPHHLRKVTERGPVLDFYVEAKGGVTVLRLVHSGFLTTADWDGEYNGTKAGWPIYFRILTHGLTRHRGALARNMDLYGMSEEPVESIRKKLAELGPGGANWWIWPEKNDAMVHAVCMSMGAKTMVWVNVATFGLSVEEAEEIRGEWQKKLDGLLPAGAKETCA